MDPSQKIKKIYEYSRLVCETIFGATNDMNICFKWILENEDNRGSFPYANNIIITIKSILENEDNCGSFPYASNIIITIKWILENEDN